MVWKRSAAFNSTTELDSPDAARQESRASGLNLSSPDGIQARTGADPGAATAKADSLLAKASEAARVVDWCTQMRRLVVFMFPSQILRQCTLRVKRFRQSFS